MKPDAAIEEIRAVRHEISAEHGHEPRALLNHYRELESKREYQSRLLKPQVSSPQKTQDVATVE